MKELVAMHVAINKKLDKLSNRKNSKISNNLNLQMCGPNYISGRIYITCNITESKNNGVRTTVRKVLELDYLKHMNILDDEDETLSVAFKKLFGLELPEEVALEIKTYHKAGVDTKGLICSSLNDNLKFINSRIFFAGISTIENKDDLLIFTLSSKEYPDSKLTYNRTDKTLSFSYTSDGFNINLEPNHQSLLETKRIIEGLII